MRRIIKKLLFPPIALLLLALSQGNCQSPIIQWQKCYGGSSADVASSIKPLFEGGYVIAGYTESTDGNVTGLHNGIYGDVWIIRIDSSGSVLWNKCLGGSNSDAANAIEQTNDKGFIVAGFTMSDDGDVTFNHGDLDGWIVKLDSSGSIQWQKSYGGSKTEILMDIKQTPDGGYIAVGYTNSRDGDVQGLHIDLDVEDFWVVKVDSLGSLQWQKCLGGIFVDKAYAVDLTADGNYIVGGYTGSNSWDVSGLHGKEDIWLVKVDNVGTIIWQKCYGGSENEEANALQVVSDGGCIIAGYTMSNDQDVTGFHPSNNQNIDAVDAWVIKTDSLGNLQKQKCLGGSLGEGMSSIQQTFDGGYIVAGSTESNDGDVNGLHFGTDYWIVKLDSSLNIEWQRCLGGGGNDGLPVVRQTLDAGYIISGLSNSNNGDVSGNHGGLDDIWTVKLSPEPLKVKDKGELKEISIYPNPVQSELIIKGESIEKIEVYDILGKMILHSELKNHKQASIDISALAQGVYMVRVTQGNMVSSTKFLKQ